MHLCTQYLRPPFPERHRWADDLAEIRATGLDTVVLSAPWAWMEPAPGEFDFGDHDEIVETAGRIGLQVVINIWAELQPAWIHRELPDASMVDHMGRDVVSSQLAYAQFGLSPGGCTDHPGVRERTSSFLTATAQRYAGADNLLLWDCWNEMRWLTQSDGYVCHCRHTVATFRDWLRERHGDLDGLNAAWHRRYRSWDDVHPGKLPTRTYTDVMAFGAFLTHRAAVDLRWRRDAVRAGDPDHPIVAHTVFPSVSCTGEFFEFEPALARGNDWELADVVDGLGSSHFPAWLGIAPVDMAARLEAGRCAARDKIYWMSELQGGAAGHGLQAMAPVPAREQERWIWTGIARGVKGVSFWSWRDEVFGRESGGFGIVGEDGHREERLAMLRATADVLGAHGAVLDAYRPDDARVGVVLEPDTYHLDWAATLGKGPASDGTDPFQAGHSVQGWLRALERLQVPYDVLDPAHATSLASYRVLVLPWPLVVDPGFGARVLAWTRDGGTLVTEAGLDAFDPNGLYRYPDERPFAAALGLRSLGRRQLDDHPLAFEYHGVRGALATATWVEPHARDTGQGDTHVVASDERGPTIVRRGVGAGHVLSIGTFAALAYWHRRDRDVERLLSEVLAEASALPAWWCDVTDGEHVQWRHGVAAGHELLFVTNTGPPVDVRLTGRPTLDGLPVTARDLRTGAAVPLGRDGDDLVVPLHLEPDDVRVVQIGAEG